jgi:hypothetical protein
VAPRPGPEATPRPPRFARAVGLGTFVVVLCGAAVSTGDTQRFAVLAIAGGLGWAVLCAAWRRLGRFNTQDLRKAAGFALIVSAMSEIVRWPGRR